MCKTWLCCLGALAALHIASTGFFVPSQPAPRDAQRRWPRKRRARVLAALPQSGEQMPALRYLGDPDLMKSQPCVLEEAIESEEGCLSVPGLRGWVERANEVVMRGFDEHGQPQEAQLSGLAARIAQHELDHLDGILFPTRVSDTRWLVPQKVFDNKDDGLVGMRADGKIPAGQVQCFC
eukprot:g15998.t1